MPVTITWDNDAPITGQPDAGSAQKVYSDAGPGTVTITDEAIGGESRTLHYDVPLPLTAVQAVPGQVDSGGDLNDRTTTVAGQGFPPSTPGTVSIATGAPGAYGTTVTSTGATTNASGIFTGVDLTVPTGLDAGDYHIEAMFGDIGDLDTALTVVHLVLDAPTNVASPSQTATTIDLTWDAVTDADEYVVRWSLVGEASWTELAPVATTSDTVTGLDASTSYDVQVKATAIGAGDSPWSATLTVDTTVQPQLDAPTNLAAGTPTATEVPLTWDAVVDAEGYVVGWREIAGIWNEIPGVETPSHTVTGLDPLVEYEFRVRAVADGFTESDWSPVVTATTEALGTLDAPTNVASPSQTATTIDLTWDAVTNADSYGVEQALAGSGSWIEIGTTLTNDHTATGLDPSTSYDFRVAARAAGWHASDWSTVFTQSTTA